jgi:hypothetical protein
MTQGRKELRSIRLRLEAINGVRETPRFLWRGNGDMPQDAREIVKVEEQIGIFGGADRTYMSKMSGQISFADTELTFEQVGDVLLAAGLGTLWPTYAGSVIANSNSVRQSLFVPTTETIPVASFTIEAGDNVEAEVLPYGICTKVDIQGAGGEPLRLSSDWQSQYVARTNPEGTFSAVGTLPAVEVALASRGSVWLTDAGVAGSWLVTGGNLLSFSVGYEPKWAWKYSVDFGTTYPVRAVYTGAEISGQFTFEFQPGTFGGAGTAGQKEKWRGQTAQILEMKFFGGTITGGTTVAGTSYENKEFGFKLPIKYDSFNAIDDQDGNSVISASWTSRYNELTPTLGRGRFWVTRSGTSEFSGA